jgi:hypothetical protein
LAGEVGRQLVHRVPVLSSMYSLSSSVGNGSPIARRSSR